MANQLYRQENTVVLVQGTKVTDFPIVDSYFYYDEVPQSYTIKSVQSRKTASIPRADIGTYKNELDVAYTEQSLLSFLRFYCSLTDRIPESILPPNFPTLPSGTYTPKNTVGGDFDLLWEEATSDVTTDDGLITQTGGAGAFDKGAIVKVDHNGDFELRFKKDFDPSFSGFVGLSYFHAFFNYPNLDFSFYFVGSTDLQCWQKGQPVSGGAVGGLTASSQFRIKRAGIKVQYYVDTILIVETEILNTGPMNIDFALNSLYSITDIEIIIP